jgi:hypothetical protein
MIDARNWRIVPPPQVAYEIHQLALAEGRSRSNMILRLVTEALEKRRRECDERATA